MKSGKKTIRAWIDNSDLSEFITDNPNGFDYDEIFTRTDILDLLEEKIDEKCDEAFDLGKEENEDDYDRGFEAGKEEAEPTSVDEVSELLQEEIGVNFVVDKFKDCKTLEDFQTEYSYIYSRSLNFMR